MFKDASPRWLDVFDVSQTVLDQFNISGPVEDERIVLNAIDIKCYATLFEYTRRGYPKTSPSVCRSAAMHGYNDILGYLHVNGYPWNHSTVLGAILTNHPHCARYALANGCGATCISSEIAIMYGYNDIAVMIDEYKYY